MLFEGLQRQLSRKENVFFSAATDVGVVREQNQDNLFLMRPALSPRELQHYTVGGTQKLPVLFAVCDGMGGGRYGEQASGMAVERIARIDVDSLENLSDHELACFFTELYEDMNREVFEKFRQWRSLVGCTSTIFYADRRRIWLINAGDSPGMRLDSGGLQVLTKSDNRAHQLYLLGQISEEERWTHKTKNQLTQYIGMDAREVRLSPHICRLEPQGEPAVFLICSDGLLDRQKFSELEKLLRESAERDWLPQCAQRCVQYAMEHGSRDNISAIIVKVGATHDA